MHHVSVIKRRTATDQAWTKRTCTNINNKQYSILIAKRDCAQRALTSAKAPDVNQQWSGIQILINPDLDQDVC